MLEKATQFAVSLGVEHFPGSSGWFKVHNYIVDSNIIEKADANSVSAVEWIKNVLPQEIEGYT